MTENTGMRLEAEARLGKIPEDLAELTPLQSRRLLHDLRVHQIELEMQNEELRRIQTQLDDACARYFDLFELAPVGYVTLSESGQMLEANLTAATLLGVARGSLSGQLFSSFVFKDDQACYYLHCKHLFASGLAQACELRMVKKGGAIFWAHLESTLAQTPDGKPANRMVLNDISMRKTAQRQVETILRTMMDGFYLVDLHGQFLDANDSYCRMIGYSHAEMLKMGVKDVEALDSEAAIQARLRQIQGIGHTRFETRHRRKDGTLLDIEASVDVLDGDPVRFVAVMRDISERKRADLALKESLREKEALLREIHHRVKNNMQVVSSLLRLQANEIANPTARDALLDMQHRVHSMALVHEHLYRSENLAAVDLATYLQQLCNQLLRSSATAPGRIQLHLNLSPLRLGIDQAIPCGLLVNELITNALKHAFPDGRCGEIRVDLQALTDRPAWRLCVADNGVGLPPDFAMEHLKSLGLMLVSDLARQLGGRLEIGTGPGTLFTIDFTQSP